MNLDLKQKDVDIPEKEEYRQEIEEEIIDGRELYAIFLIHGYIETFLREILYLRGGRVGTNKGLSNALLKQIERIPFENLLLTHIAMQIINEETFTQIKLLNKFRNKLAHNLAKIDFNHIDNRKLMIQHIETGLKACDYIYDIYQNELNQLSAEYDAEIMRDSRE